MIKIIALLTMIIDHIGLIFFPNIMSFRVIGRISMPLFAFCIAKGFYYSKKNNTLIKYMRNLLLLTLFAQIPFGYISSGTNIGATWLIAIMILTIQDVYKSKLINKTIISILLIGLAIYLKVDYSICGIMMPVIFYYYWIKEKKIRIFCVLFIALNIFYILINEGWIIQIFSGISIAIIFNYENYEEKIKLPKKFYYMFYPAHLIVLLIISKIL